MVGPDSAGALEQVCVLVASAAGHEAIAEVLAGDEDGRTAFVVVTKCSEGPSMLLETLRAHADLSVFEVECRRVVEPGAIYVATPGAQLLVEGKEVRSEPVLSTCATPDRVLAAVARWWGPRCCAVVLSGGGLSVRAGARAVLDTGGALYVQSPATARLQDLPSAVLTEVGASGVGGPSEIRDWVRRGLSASVRDTGELERLEQPLTPAFWKLLEEVRLVTELDLYAYRTATLYRRVMQRARALGCDRIEAYLEIALRDRAELKHLGPRLLIGTTDFFRNAPLFDELERLVVPAVRDRATVAVWCAGCSTGEEAYSVAATLHSALKASGSSARVRMLATDVRPGAIEVAAAGSYSLERAQGLPRTLRERYGRVEGDRWVVGEALRDCIHFAVHDVLTDPPPEDRDLVLFRNVMIYLRPELHAGALERTRRALRPGGFLAVGESESTHSLEHGFARYASDGMILQRPVSSAT